MPALRSRGSDVLLLSQHFLTHFAAQANSEVLGISKTETFNQFGRELNFNL
mgnify:CR=1 FL=1